jgi:oxygen-independent coproporphyrinogen-3 oxidase
MKKNNFLSDEIGSSLGSISGPFSVYIHIPFCLRKCPYCSFFSVPATPGGCEKYLDLLKKEILFYRAFLGKESEASTLYFGGGTPTCSPLSSGRAFWHSVARTFRFHRLRK